MMKKYTQKEYDTDMQKIKIDYDYGEVFFPVKLKQTYSVSNNHFKMNYTIKQIHLNPIANNAIKLNDEGLIVLENNGVEFVLDVSLEELKQKAHLALAKFKENFEFDPKKDYFSAKLYPCKVKDYQHFQEKAKDYVRTRSVKRIFQNFCQDTNFLQKKLVLCEYNPN